MTSRVDELAMYPSIEGSDFADLDCIAQEIRQLYLRQSNSQNTKIDLSQPMNELYNKSADLSLDMPEISPIVASRVIAATLPEFKVNGTQFTSLKPNQFSLELTGATLEGLDDGFNSLFQGLTDRVDDRLFMTNVNPGVKLQMQEFSSFRRFRIIESDEDIPSAVFEVPYAYDSEENPAWFVQLTDFTDGELSQTNGNALKIIGLFQKYNRINGETR